MIVGEIDKAGGYAFPHTVKMGDGATLSYPGMTLRDYFAGQVLPAVYQTVESGTEFEIVVHEAYDIADAMIKARAER